MADWNSWGAVPPSRPAHAPSAGWDDDAQPHSSPQPYGASSSEQVSSCSSSRFVIPLHPHHYHCLRYSLSPSLPLLRSSHIHLVFQTTKTFFFSSFPFALFTKPSPSIFISSSFSCRYPAHIPPPCSSSSLRRFKSTAIIASTCSGCILPCHCQQQQSIY